MAHSRKPSKDPDFYTRLTKEVIGSPGLGSAPSNVLSSLNSSSAFANSQSRTDTSLTESEAVPLLSKKTISELDEAVVKNPFDLVQILPSITAMLEQHVLAHPEQCAAVWEYVKAALLNITSDKQKIKQGWSKELSVTLKSMAPLAAKLPDSHVNVHGDVWTDDFSWLKAKDDERVLDYIAAENKYADQELKPTKPLQRLLYKEFVCRYKENESSAPVTLPNGMEYFTRTVAGQEHKQHVRRDQTTGLEYVYLDENELVNLPQLADLEFTQLRLGFLRYTDDVNKLAIGIDTSGSERYISLFFDMKSGTYYDDQLENIYDCLDWSADGSSVFYLSLDENDRAYRFMCHKLGTPVEEDLLLYEETDESFFLSFSKSGNGKWILLNSAAQVTSETRYTSTEDLQFGVKLVKPKQERVSYTVKAHDSFFYVLTNEGDKALSRSSANGSNWIYKIAIDDRCGELEPEMFIEPRDFVLVEDFVIMESHIAIFERSNCHQNVRIIDLETQRYHYISFSDTVYSLWPNAVEASVSDIERIASWSSKKLRFTFSTLITPKQVVDYDMVLRTWTVVRQEKVGPSPDGQHYNPLQYTQQRLYVTGIDGTTIPLSIVYRTDLLAMSLRPRSEGNSANPCLLHSYGAYGSCMNPMFSPTRLALLDRGFVFAIAHVRGGSDMGHAWYEDGKLDKKINSILDFISCAEFLCNEGFTTRGQLAAYGHSAGGLLVTASVMMRPDLFTSVVVEVPFLDVINSMFNTSLPWTAFEYEEWGDPSDPLIYQVMKSYCPYTQLDHATFTRFPDIFIIGGMNDPRVSFYEPLKFVAKLRNRYHELLQKKVKSSQGQRDAEIEVQKVASPPTSKNAGSHAKLNSFDMNMKKRELHLQNVEKFEMQKPAADEALKSEKNGLLKVDTNRQVGESAIADLTVILKIEDTGHGGAVGQYAQLRDIAREYAFLITRVKAPLKPIPLGLLLQTGSDILSQGSLILTVKGGSNVIWGRSSLLNPPTTSGGGVALADGEEEDDYEEEDDDDDDDIAMSASSAMDSPTDLLYGNLPKAKTSFKTKFKGLRRILSFNGSARLNRRKDVDDASVSFHRKRQQAKVQDWIRNVF